MWGRASRKSAATRHLAEHLDLRVRGLPPEGDQWPIAVENPTDPTRNLFTVGLDAGGVATSSRLWRRWDSNDGGAQHHILDPRTGRPASGRLVAVTAIAVAAWWAEVVATSSFVAGKSARHADLRETMIATVDRDGGVEMSPGLAAVAL